MNTIEIRQSAANFSLPMLMGAITGGAIMGCLSTWAFTSLSPYMGLVHGASLGLASYLVHLQEKDSIASCLAGKLIAVAAAALTTMVYLGTPLSLKTVFYLNASLFAFGSLLGISVIIVSCALIALLKNQSQEGSPAYSSP